MNKLEKSIAEDYKRKYGVFPTAELTAEIKINIKIPGKKKRTYKRNASFLSDEVYNKLFKQSLR